jgi:hypothetical protein
MLLTIDLDSVIFNMRPLYNKAFRRAGCDYKKQTSWDIDTIYEEDVCRNLIDLWSSDYLYTMPVLDKKIPQILNQLMARKDMDVLFVTERLLKQPEKSFEQLRRAGIECTFNQVVDKDGLKSDILQELKPDMHFDDSPYVIKGCIKKSVPVVMISNNSTLYNHDLRDKVEYYPNLRTALIKKGLVQNIK